MDHEKPQSQSKSQRDALAETQRKLWTDPEYKSRTLENARKALAAPEVRARMAKKARASWADPETRARRVAALTAANAPAVRRRKKAERLGIEVPKWVEAAGLADDFLKIALADGEEAAASHCRRLKRDLPRLS